MKHIAITIIRAIQAFFALVALALGAYVANWYNTQTLTTAPTEINFMIFVPVFALIAIVYLEAVPRFVPRASHPWVSIVTEATTALFWFGGFIALAVFLTRLLFCRGPVCVAAKATAATGGLQWVLWVVTLGFTIKERFKPGFRRPAAMRPAMKETV